MHQCKDEDAPTVFASAILREVPLARLDSYLSVIGKGDFGPLSIGDACGNGCGSGCGNNCLRPIDVLGHTSLSLKQLNDVISNEAGLRKALGEQISTVARAVC